MGFERRHFIFDDEHRTHAAPHLAIGTTGWDFSMLRKAGLGVWHAYLPLLSQFLADAVSRECHGDEGQKLKTGENSADFRR